MSSFLDRLYSTLLETDEIKTADPAVREFLKYGTHGTHNIMTKGTFVTWLSLFVITLGNYTFKSHLFRFSEYRNSYELLQKNQKKTLQLLSIEFSHDQLNSYQFYVESFY